MTGRDPDDLDERLSELSADVLAHDGAIDFQDDHTVDEFGPVRRVTITLRALNKPLRFPAAGGRNYPSGGVPSKNFSGVGTTPTEFFVPRGESPMASARRRLADLDAYEAADRVHDAIRETVTGPGIAPPPLVAAAELPPLEPLSADLYTVGPAPQTAVQRFCAWVIRDIYRKILGVSAEDQARAHWAACATRNSGPSTVAVPPCSTVTAGRSLSDEGETDR